MSTLPNTWIIIKTDYEIPTDFLYYTLEGGGTGTIVVRSDNTLKMPSIDGIKDKDFIVLDMTNIKSYSEAAEYIANIDKEIEVMLFVGDGNYGESFSITENVNLSTFRIRQQINTVTNEKSGKINLNTNSTLTSIDINRFKLVELIANNCPGLTNLTFTSSSAISKLDLENCSSITGITDLSTTYFSSTPAINLSGTNITSINIDGLNLTNITYPAIMKILTIQNSPYDGDLDLSSYEDLTNVTLDSCDNLTSITTKAVDEKISLKSLKNCESINIENAESSNSQIFIGGDTNGKFMLDEFPELKTLTISNYNVDTISLSSTESNDILTSLNITGSTCKSINLPFTTFGNMKRLYFGGCNNLATFNDAEVKEFIATNIGSLEYVDLTSTSFTSINVSGSSNIAYIIFPLPVERIEMDGLLKIKSFDMSQYKKLKYLNINNTKITSLVGNYDELEDFNMEIYATHDEFKLLEISNRNINIIDFSENGFSKINCFNCTFLADTNLSKYVNLTDVTLTNCTLQAIALNKNVENLNVSRSSFASIMINDLQTSHLTNANLNDCASFKGFNGEAGISNLPASIEVLYLNNTSVTSIDLNSTNANLSELTPPNSIESISVPGISNLRGFYIDNEITTDISVLTELTSLNINGTGFPQLIGTGSVNPKLSSVGATGISIIKLTGYSSLVSLDVSTISNLNISNCPSINGSFTIPSITNDASININGTSISDLTISNPEKRHSIRNLTLSDSTSNLTLENIIYQNQLPISNSLKTLTLNNCGIETVSSSTEHLDEFNLYANDGSLKNFDIGNFVDIRNLHLQNLNEFNFLINGQSTSAIGGGRWNNTEIFDITANISELQIDLSGNNKKISKFNLNSSNLNTLSITGWNPNPDDNSINFSTDNLSNLSLINSTPDILLPVSFKEMPKLQNLNITDSNFTSLDFEYEEPNSILTTITATSSSLNSISLANTNALNELYLDGTNISEIDLNNCKSLQTIDLSDTGISEFEISNLNKLTHLALSNCVLEVLKIDSCKKLNNDYLQNLTISDSAEFRNLGLYIPESISFIKPKSLTIINTNWSKFTLNGALLENIGTSIEIVENNILTALSFTDTQGELKYGNINISYNQHLKSINGKTEILEICELLKASLIGFDEVDEYKNLKIKLVMNSFTSGSSSELPQYLGIWPQIERYYVLYRNLIGEINFKAISAADDVSNEFVGIEPSSTTSNLLEFALKNITVWKPGEYTTSESIDTLEFPDIFSVYFPIKLVLINGNRLLAILAAMFEAGKKPKLIYTNNYLLKYAANKYNIPVEIMNIKISDPDYPQQNVFNIHLVVDSPGEIEIEPIKNSFSN